MFRLASKRAVAGLRKGSAASAPMPSRSCRAFASQRGDIHPDLLKAPYTMAGHEKIVSPPVVYISGEEMTKYTMELIMDQWIRPHIDTTAWEFFDLSCKARDESNDAVLHDAVAAGAKCGSIFKEPTITPSAAQVKEFGLSQSLPSPNGAMRRGWNGITISRDTIHIEGVKLGFEKPVLFERHAIGGEYVNMGEVVCLELWLVLYTVVVIFPI